MLEQTNPPAEGNQQVVGQNPPAAPGQPAGQGDPWETRYRGLSTVFETTRKDSETAKSKVADLELQLVTTSTEAQKKLTEAETEKTRLTKELADKAKILAEKDTQLASAAAFQTKMKVLKEFPQLMKVEHLLPTTADETDLRAKAKELADFLTTTVSTEVETRLKAASAGFTPGPTNTAPIGEFPYQTEEAWGKAILKASDTGTREDFKRLDAAFKKWREARRK